MRIAPLALVLSLAAVAPVPAEAQAASRASSRATFEVDTVHSELTFRIRHLLGRVAGTFGDWRGTIVTDTTNLANSTVDISIRTASIDTRVSARDAHLRTPDFFAADSFPELRFRSTGVVTSGTTLFVTGDLTIRGRTRPVVLTGTYNGLFDDPWGGRRMAFIASTTIDRREFGVAFNGPFQTIGQIGNDVEISIAVEAVRK